MNTASTVEFGTIQLTEGIGITHVVALTLESFCEIFSEYSRLYKGVKKFEAIYAPRYPGNPYHGEPYHYDGMQSKDRYWWFVHWHPEHKHTFKYSFKDESALYANVAVEFCDGTKLLFLVDFGGKFHQFAQMMRRNGCSLHRVVQPCIHYWALNFAS